MNQSLAEDQKSAYESERARLACRRLRAACLLGVFILPVYAVMDHLLYPEYFNLLLVVRLATVGFAGCVLLLLKTEAGSRHADPLGMAVGVAFVLAASAIPVYLIGYAVPYYVGFIIVIFGMALLLPWRFTHVAALSFGLLLLYVAASLLHGPIGNASAFLCNTSFIGAAIAIAMVSMDAAEKLRRCEYAGRVALLKAFRSKDQLATALADKTAKLEALNREMEDLLYVASHDLRAPLINVQGFSRELHLALDTLRSHNGKSPETNAALSDIDESLQFILTGVARMDGLIASLLNVSRIVTRTKPTEQVDLNVLVRKLVDSFHYQLTEKDIAIDIDPLPVVTGDASRLGQLFGNLIDNAIKYMGKRPRRLIHIGTSRQGDESSFFVRDSGPGIPADQHEQVFRLFRRLANGNSPGEGIGLTMVRKIVEKHGGRIWVESTPGDGATFWFTLNSGPPTLDIGGTI